MLAVLGTAVQENFHPLWGFNEKEMDGAIFHFQVRGLPIDVTASVDRQGF